MPETRSWIGLALREWTIARMYFHGDDTVLDELVDMPDWFVPFELGFHPKHGPSIVAVFRHLDDINREHRQFLDSGKKKRGHTNAQARHQWWQELLRRNAVSRTRDRVERRRARAARHPG